MQRLSLWTLGIAALAFAALGLPSQSTVIERLYSGLAYPAVQRVTTTISNLVPFALFDALIVGFPLVWFGLAADDVAHADRKLAALGRWLLRTVAAASIF